ncbi:transcription factor bHLH130-like isoform X2 [Phragmites australis]|uniref:transcription factor bHLH130-like isoform X2 n=1 Tax=Phragmites australis TaxID=29695 RepID=UPI002D77FD7C|nr:transcription factor bHLH130-like isoform X2 [Phragmites australis]
MYGSPVSKDLNLPVQPAMSSSGLLRYRSAPSTLLGEVCDDFIPAGPRAASPDAGADNVFTRFLSDHHIREDKPSPPAPPVPAAVHFPNEAAMASQQQQMMFHSQQQQQSGLYRTVSSGTEVAAAAGVGASSLIRQSSSPAGFLNHLNLDNGYGGMLRAGMGFRNGSSASAADSPAGGGIRLKGQLSFSSRQGSLMSQISEMGSEELGGSSPEAAGGGRGYIPGYLMGSGWEDSSSLMSENLSGMKRPRDSSEPGQNGLTHQFSLPSSEMATIEKFLQFQDAVPCKIRAKRGCATHPRSIAERVRRTKISERIRKLQELVPNMDKQTNTSDMLDLAVDYIKELQKQVLNESRANCTCSASKSQQYSG